MIENASESHKKVQLEAECNEMDKIETPLIPASGLDRSAEFATAFNHSDADNSVQMVEEDSSEHDGIESMNESPVMNGSTEKDESFIPETQFETSIDFDVGDSSVDYKKTDPKIYTDSVSQIESVKSFISDAIESNDLFSVSEKQDDTCEDVDQENVPIGITEAENGAVIEKGEFKFN